MRRWPESMRPSSRVRASPVTSATPATVPKGHARRFRDTFAVELLLAGVPLERVSVLLGHASIKVTGKHYAPWVQERQVVS